MAQGGNGQTDGQTDGCTDGWTDGWMDLRKISPFYRTLFFIGATAQKLKNVFFCFWEVGEVQRAAIFCLRCHEKDRLDPEPNVSGYETHNIPSYDLDTPF